MFIAIEGIDGSGKTTQKDLLDKYLTQLNVAHIATREPTDRKFGIELRKRLKDPHSDPQQDARLFALDRKDHYLNVIKPALRKNMTVITDRYLDSSLAYQSVQCKAFFPSISQSFEWIAKLNAEVDFPDITFLLDADPEVTLKRRFAQTSTQNLEKFEKKDFLTDVRSQFLTCVKRDPKAYVIIDATQSAETIHALIKNFVTPLIHT